MMFLLAAAALDGAKAISGIGTPARPSPYLVWAEEGAVPTEPPPAYEQCHGCSCLVAQPEAFFEHGAVVPKYRCNSSSPVAPTPELRWSVSQKVAPGQTFAVTVADLDYPNGLGSAGNRVHCLYWVANLPSSWTGLNDELLDAAKEQNLGIVVGRSGGGVPGMERVCPKTGMHRYRLTVWALRTALTDLSSGTRYTEVLAQFEAAELSRHTFFARATPEATPKATPEAAKEASLLQRGGLLGARARRAAR